MDVFKNAFSPKILKLLHEINMGEQINYHLRKKIQYAIR